MSVLIELSGNLSLNAKILSQYIGKWLVHKRSQLFSSNRRVFLLFTWHMTVECCLTWLGFIYTLCSGCCLVEVFKHASFSIRFVFAVYSCIMNIKTKNQKSPGSSLSPYSSVAFSRLKLPLKGQLFWKVLVPVYKLFSLQVPWNSGVLQTLDVGG